MRIAIDGSDLAAERFEGPSVYAGALLPRLTQALRERGHLVHTYTPGPLCGVTVAGELHVIPGSPWWTQRVLARALYRDNPDALFLPIQALPVVRPRRMTTVAVVHDLEFLHFPRTYTVRNRLLLHVFTKQAVRQATKLIAVSQYTKDDIVRTYRRNPSDISVVHHGVDERFLRAGSEHEESTIRARYGVTAPYILFVGALQPRKNIVGLLGAFEDVLRAAPDYHLVLVSGGAWKEGHIIREIQRSRIDQRVHVLRRIAHDDLRAFYRGAACFILPSFSEGFGMPVLEAMATGIPVVASRTSSLPEIGGDAVEYVDPKAVRDIARGITAVLSDPRRRQQLIEKGRRRASQFSWDRAAQETAGVIEATGQGA